MRQLTLVGLIVLLVASYGCKSPANAQAPPAATQAPAQKPAQAGGIQWQTDLTAAMAQARAENKTLIVDFWATWCGHCQAMEQKTWPDPAVVAAAADFIMVKQDVDKCGEVAKKYKIDGIPAIFFIAPDGTTKQRQVGEVSASQMVKLMKSNK